MRWWPRKPAPPDATPFIEDDPALETSPRTTKCARPDCFNDIPPDRDRFCSDECLKAYSVSVMGKIRGLRRSEEHTSELQSQSNLVCRLLLEKKKKKKDVQNHDNHK